VAREFSEILGAGVGRNTDFFSLGGNSLLATRLLWAVEAKFSVALALRDFLRTPTVAGVAARVRDAQEAPSDRHAAPAPPAQGARQQLDAIFDEILGTPE
jgi:acyl carrier protein